MLLAEAMLQPIVDPEIECALAQVDVAGGDVPIRLDALVLALQAATRAHEDAFRTLLRISLTPPSWAASRGDATTRWPASPLD